MQRSNRRLGGLQPKRIVIAVSTAFLPWLSSEAVLADPAANQLPTGGNVAAGAASISVTGSKMQIDQASDKAILNWQNFSIGKDGWVNFSQPSSSSVALNRSLQPAEIFGRLSANGQVFITSSAGVYFARTASVDVGGLVATNLSIRDQDFMAGRYVFSNEGSSGSVVNDGTIITPSGYAALAGTQVRNNGVIVAQAGTVALAAGDRVTLDMVGDGLIKVSVDAAALNALALNSGTIQADGGRVVLTARSANALLDTVVNNTGVIRAKSLVERNGEIVLDGGSGGVVANGGTLDASGGAGTTGGTVKASGQYVVLSEGSSIDASGNAGGGTVTVSATDAAFVYGSIDARDTGGNGKGGTVETSGRYLEVTRAPSVGAGGTWLIDPYNIDVVADVPPPGFSNNTGPTTFTPSGDSSQIAASLITDQLNTGSNVVLDTGGAGSPGTQAGDIRVLAAIDKTVANSASLSLNAFHDVQVNQPINIASAFGPTGFGTLHVDAGNNVIVSAPITTQGGGLTIRAGGFTNLSAISNGVGGDLKPGMSITADRFNLAGGTINGGQGSVGLFTRSATNSFGVESAGDTTITNADIASITTSPDLPSTNANQLLIGVGSGGAMTIGANAQVNGGSKNLVFSASGGPGTRVTVGANGVTTTGDVAVDATGGAIAGTGTIGGNHVQLIATTGIGTSTARVGTAAGTLAARTTNGSAFIAEADNVTLGAVTLAGRTVTNGVAPGNAYDLTAGGDVAIDGVVSVGGRLNLNAGGALNLNAAGVQDSQLFSSGGQTVSAAALSMNAQDGRRAVVSNTGGSQALMIGAGGMNLNVVAGAGVAQIANNAGSGTQTVTTSGALNVVGGSAAPSTNSGIFQNQTGKQTVTAGSISLQGALVGNNGGAFISNTGGNGDQEINVAGGTISIAAGAVGLANRAFISSNGNQTINGDPDIVITGGTSGAGTAAANTSNGAGINTNGVGKAQTIHAGNITLNAGSGGNETFALISGANQVIAASGDVRITGGDGTGTVLARIGGIGGALPGATNLTLNARDVVITGGSAAGGEAGLGSTAIGASQPNTITVNATRDVILNSGAGAGARIGTSQVFAAPAGGDVTVNAGVSIQLNGTTQPTAIRTTGNVTLNAGSISEASNGLIVAGGLNTASSGNTSLTGPNQVSNFNGSSGGDLSLTNAGDLTINNNTSSTGAMTLEVAGKLSVSASGTQDAIVHSFGGQTITARAVEVSARDGRTASLWNTGPGSQSITASNGAGVDVVVSSGGGFAQIQADGGSSQSVSVVDGDHINVNGATGSASIIAFNTPQTLSITGSGANAITMGSSGAGSSFAHGSLHQSVTAGNPGESGSITIVGPGVVSALAGLYDNPNLGGTQTISTSGTISITGGSAPSQLSNFFTGIAHNGSGQQTITAAGVSLTGGSSGNGNGVTIGAFGGGVAANAGMQVIDVGGGNISIAGGAGGNANTALINALRDQTILAGGTLSVSGGAVGTGNRAGIVAGGNQTISGDPDIIVTGGSSGGVALNGNNAFINASGGVGTQQTINAGSITLRSGSGGIDNSASMSARKQVITVNGDVNLIGGASAGTLGGVRLGGLGGATLTSTDLTLTLNNGGNLTLEGGSVATNTVSIGSGVGTAPLSNNITVIAGGNVVLDPGSAAARIGNHISAPASDGDISINAASIQLNGTGATPAYIRTSGNVSLSTFGGGISEGTNGYVQAGVLNVIAGGDANLVGPNQIGLFNASGPGLTSMPGSLNLNNAGDLGIGNVFVAGALTMNVAGAVKLDADATHDASVFSNGQTINAQSLSVTSRDGRTAVLNSGGDQTISIAGGSVDVETFGPSGIAQVAAFVPGSSQSITVTNGDHIRISNGGSIFAGGNQSLSATGTGRNAIEVGSAGAARGSAILAGRNQDVTAGTDGESGSITITGPSAAGTGVSGFVTVSGVGADTQTISTTGTLRVNGGTAPVQQPNVNSGIFHNRQGQQTVSAADIVVRGGTSGSNNGAFISSNGPNPGGPGGGDQVVNATGGITVMGSDAGTNNRAFISSNRNQTINGNPDIVIYGGASSISGATVAGISAASGWQQTINAGNITMSNAASGGTDAFAGIIGSNQIINATGNVVLTGGGSGGTLPGVRIGGFGGAAPSATNLTMHIGGDLILTGGTQTSNGASIGSSAVSAQPNNIVIDAGGSVILNPGSGAGSRIGSAAGNVGGGNIAITAGHNIELNGVTQVTAIRTTGNVTLNAGGAISEAAAGSIHASTLNVGATGNVTLSGPNEVALFGGWSTSGDISLVNSSSLLTLDTMNLSGSLSVDQTGALAVPGTVTSQNQSLSASGDVTIGRADGFGPAGLFAPGTITISTPQSIVLRGSDLGLAGAAIVAAGGQVTLNAGEIHLTGGAAPLAAASVLGGELLITSARDISLTAGSGWNADALLYSRGDITMTVGGILTIDGGHRPDNWARVQTERRDGTITLNFPNAHSGSFFVDGFEGKIKHGQDGFFTADKPAKLDHTLFLRYGL